MAKGMHPNSLKALEATKWKKGKTPTGGRPKGALSLKERMDKYINLETKVVMPDGTITDKEVMDSIVLALLAKARKGDVPAAKEILDRYYGKQSDKLELTGKDGQPLEVQHTERLRDAWDGLADAFINARKGDDTSPSKD